MKIKEAILHYKNISKDSLLYNILKHYEMAIRNHLFELDIETECVLEFAFKLCRSIKDNNGVESSLYRYFGYNDLVSLCKSLIKLHSKSTDINFDNMFIMKDNKQSVDIIKTLY